MALTVILKDLRSKISYRGIIVQSKIEQGIPIMVELTGTILPVGFQTGLITGWLHDVNDASKMYIFDSQGGRFLFHFYQSPINA